ncbi:DUF5060 domain-containing protein [Planctomycetota bacterium]
MDGSFKKWHRIEVVFTGPQADESSATFRNHRLDVTFTSPSGKEYKVPGFFDADGDPANSSATSGNKWKARFTGGEEGDWTYKVSFVTGNNVAANLTGGTGGTAPDGEAGSFSIGSQDKSGKDFRAKGKLQYVGEHYLRFEDGDYFVKGGPDSPEIFLEYGEFDGTPNNAQQKYSHHISDWKNGDPTWGKGKGKGIIGVVNYLAGTGVNVHYFLCMNAYGDGKDAWPWTGVDNIDIYDVSKLGQWEVVFTHFDKMGLMLNFQMSESENSSYFEVRDGDGVFASSRKIFYRELIARFGHHMAITWNIGEENQDDKPGIQRGVTDAQRKLFSTRLRNLAVYQDHISVHNGPADKVEMFYPLLGHKDFTGPGFQFRLNNQIHDKVKHWYDESEKAGHKWIISVDEPWMGTYKDIVALRKEAFWGSVMAGGQAEFYLGKFDVKHVDYRDYDDEWKMIGNLVTFMNGNLAKELVKMKPNDALAIGNNNWALAAEGETYLLYLKNGGEAKVDLSGAEDQEFTVQWFNPRSGGHLINGTPGTVSGGGVNVSLGTPPNTAGQDWVVLLKSAEFTPVFNND